MGSLGAVHKNIGAILLILVLVASGPGAALPVHPEGDTGAQDPLPENDLLDDPLLDGLEPGLDSDGPLKTTRGILAGLKDWLARTDTLSLDRLRTLALAEAPEAGQRLLATPDSFPSYASRDEGTRHEAWQSWWIAAEVAAQRPPSVMADRTAGLAATADPTGEPGIPLAGAGAPQGGDNGDGGNESGEGDEPSASPVGEPHSLERLWRLQTHGPPRILLPAGADEETYLVTDRGVVHLPGPDQGPDWMLHLEGIAGHAEVIERDGHWDLVVGMHDLRRDSLTPSIWVIDGENEEIRFRGLTGDRAMLYWGLNDVDGDGEADILGVDKSGNITAIRLDGTEIHRAPVPTPDMPEEEGPGLPEGLPVYLALALEHTGLELLGDANGDGVLDVFTTSWWGVGGMDGLSSFTEHLVVAAVDGKSGDIEWEQTLEPIPGVAWRLSLPVLTGDLNGDGNDDVAVLDRHESLLPQTDNLYFSGADGTLLAKDSSFVPSPGLEGGFTCCLGYVPLAFVDTNGDGTKQIVAQQLEWVEEWDGELYFVYTSTLEVRALTGIDGTPTTIQESRQIAEDWWILPEWLQHFVHTEDNKDTFYMIVDMSGYEPDRPGSLVTVDDTGINTEELPQPLGHFTANPVTGQRYAWILENDQWTRVDEDLRPVGNGTQLIMSSHAILHHDRDGDETPDLLIRRSTGYFWVSGRNGTITDTVERPVTTSFVGASLNDNGLVLERDSEHYILFDVIEKETRWMVSRSITEGGSVRAVADFTGDGKTEILLHEVDWEENWEDIWKVYSADRPGVVWEQRTEYGNAHVGQLDPAGNATQILLVDWESSEPEVEVHAPGADSPKLWGGRFANLDRIDTGPGLVALLIEGSEGPEVRVLTGDEGEEVYIRTLDEGENHEWSRLLKDPKGRDHLVYSHTTEQESDPDQLHQFVTTVNLAKGSRVSRFQVADPIRHEEIQEWFGWSEPIVWYDKTSPGPSVGDWNRDGHLDLALQEIDWPTVRSLKDGKPLAVGPTHGAFTFTLDLNDDGRDEVALDTGGSLRIYAWDPSKGQLDPEDPLARTEIDDPETEEDNETRERFFEQEEEKSPGPGGFVLLVLLAAGTGMIRHRRKKTS